jgi:hypothetical protein
MVDRFLSVFKPRSWFAAVLAAVFLVACGGGGGNPGTPGGSAGGGTSGGSVAPSLPPLVGTWSVTVSYPGNTTSPVTLPASAVPTSANAFASATDVARLLAATRFQNHQSTINGSTLHVVDSDTDYTMTINSFSVSQFAGCGSCGVGTTITFVLTITYAESGTFDGAALASRTQTVDLTVRYTRVS